MSEKQEVTTELIRNYIESNAPMGAEKLAVNAQVSLAVIRHAALGKAPGRRGTMKKLAKALGVSLETLFPIVSAKGRAS